MKQIKVGTRILEQRPLYDNDGNIRGKYFTFIQDVVENKNK